MEPTRRPRRRAAATAAAAVTLVAAAVGIGSYVALRVGDIGEPTPPPQASPTPSPTPSAEPSAAARYEITAKTCVRIRERPSLGAPLIDCLQPGIDLESDGGTTEADGHRWVHVYDPLKKQWGWASTQFLRPIE